MLKEEFINLIKGAKVDKYGNLYIDGEYENRVYFATITTIWNNLIEEHCYEEKNGFELCDRHFWNDDTLECKIANVGKLKSRED